MGVIGNEIIFQNNNRKENNTPKKIIESKIISQKNNRKENNTQNNNEK